MQVIKKVLDRIFSINEAENCRLVKKICDAEIEKIGLAEKCNVVNESYGWVRTYRIQITTENIYFLNRKNLVLLQSLVEKKSLLALGKGYMQTKVLVSIVDQRTDFYITNARALTINQLEALLPKTPNSHSNKQAHIAFDARKGGTGNEESKFLSNRPTTVIETDFEEHMEAATKRLKNLIDQNRQKNLNWHVNSRRNNNT